MSPRGRPRKPTALKIIEGNPGKRPLPTNEPKPKVGGVKCPKVLSPRAKKVWRDRKPELEALGLLTVIDAEAFAIFCQAYALWEESVEWIQKHGAVYMLKDEKGNPRCLQQAPYVSIMNKQALIVKAFCSEFGLTPAARARLSTEDMNREADLGNMEFMNTLD